MGRLTRRTGKEKTTGLGASAGAILFMLIITIIFYKEPKREIEGTTLKQKFRDMGTALSDVKFAIFLVFLGIFFWLPFWSFFNLLAVYIDSNLDTARLYLNIKSVLGTGVANFLSRVDEDGTRKLLGETIANTGFVILVFQIMVSRIAEKFKAIPTFLSGLFVASIAFIFLALARTSIPAWIFFGIFLFAIGEMISSPRIQEYITWIAPKEKAGLYMGSNFLAIGLGGALSGITYTSLYGYFNDIQHPEYVWYTMAAHTILGLIAIWLFAKKMGEFKELSE